MIISLKMVEFYLNNFSYVSKKRSNSFIFFFYTGTFKNTYKKIKNTKSDNSEI